MRCLCLNIKKRISDCNFSKVVFFFKCSLKIPSILVGVLASNYKVAATNKLISHDNDDLIG